MADSIADTIDRLDTGEPLETWRTNDVVGGADSGRRTVESDTECVVCHPPTRFGVGVGGERADRVDVLGDDIGLLVDGL